LWSSQGPDAYKDSTSQREQSKEEEEGPPKKKRKRAKTSSQTTELPTASGAALHTDNALKARNHFPASCEHEFGSLPIPPSCSRGKEVFPHNVSFRCADWTGTDIVEDSTGYDVVVAFSISKWIHLNALDAGLTSFFRKVHKVLVEGGVFILEPQLWDSYAKARRMSDTLKENAKKLKLKPEDFQGVLEEIGFRHETRIEVGEGGM
jgi:7SK snRNA methylphosphate capping enzyme